MPQEKPTPPPVAMTYESLSKRLREGPLRTLLTIHVRAGMLAGDTETRDDERLDKLIELVHLARVAMAQFHDFTLDLQALVDHLSDTHGKCSNS